MPKASVCIPVYNGQRYLRDAISSVLHQEFDDYELAICDNASTDDTPKICREYSDARLRYLRFEERMNQAGNFNRCLSEARGEYLTLLHADDFVSPSFLADRVKSFEDDPSLGFVFGAVNIVNANSVVTSTSNPWSEDRRFGAGELVDSLLLGCVVSPPSLMVRKSCVERVGLFRTDLTWGHDWEWTLRLAERFSTLYRSTPLAAYRVHSESGTAEQLNSAGNCHQEDYILRTALARLEVCDPRFRRLRRRAFRALSHRLMYFAEQALLGGRKRVARHNLWYAAKSDLRALSHPTFWAILAASGGSLDWYVRYRRVRHVKLPPGDRG